jgi:hypothetical protein
MSMGRLAFEWLGFGVILACISERYEGCLSNCLGNYLMVMQNCEVFTPDIIVSFARG